MVYYTKWCYRKGFDVSSCSYMTLWDMDSVTPCLRKDLIFCIHVTSKDGDQLNVHFNINYSDSCE